MASIFLSYARQDVERVRPLALDLQAAGHSVWWDQRIAAGDQFAEAIEQALDSADAVVVVWTEASCRSAWVRDEAAAGRDSGRLVPVCLDGCTPPLGFRQFQAVDLRASKGRLDGKALEPLRQAIDARVGGPATDRFELARPAGESQRGKARRRWPVWAGTVAAASLVLGATLLPRIGALWGDGSLEPKVALGAVAALSPNLPPAIDRALHDEVLAAFGEENAVTLIVGAGARERAAPFLLDGSIRHQGDALRFLFNLKDAGSGAVLWSQAFDRAAADGLAARQVAVAVSQVVRCALWGAASYPRRMPDEALTAYLHYCSAEWGGSSDERQVLDAARRVTALLPDFSFGWSALALAAVPLAQGSTAEAAALRREALAAASKASALDDHNPEGYMAEAGLLPMSRYGEREALLRKAISVRPTECGCERTALGDFLMTVGRFEEAIEQYRRAQALIPLSPTVGARLAQALFLTGRVAEAQRSVEEMQRLWPDATSVRLLRLKSAFWTRDYEPAAALLHEPGLHLSAGHVDALAQTFAALRSGDRGAKLAAAQSLGRLAADPRRNDRIVVAALAALGATAEAVAAAERLVAVRGHVAADVLFDPNLAGAGALPAYAQLLRKLGLAEYWRSSGSKPDLCGSDPETVICGSA
jgi:tetratricopeptide (TPR) repeat protein